MAISSTEDGVTLWAPERAYISVLIAVPTLVVSSIVLGILVSSLIGDRTAAAIAICVVASIMLILRLISWSAFGARHTIVATDNHLMVCRGNKTVFEASWDEVASLAIDRGDSLARLLLDVTSNQAGFPRIVTTSKDRWVNDVASPGLLAFLPRDYRRLVAAMTDECARRGVSFSAG